MPKYGHFLVVLQKLLRTSRSCRVASRYAATPKIFAINFTCPRCFTQGISTFLTHIPQVAL